MGAFGLNRLRSWSASLVGSGGRPVAIDFATSGLKVLHLSSDEQPVLECAYYLPTPDDLGDDPAKRLAWQLGELPKLIKDAGLKGKRAICSIPATQTYCKHLQIVPEQGADLGVLVRSSVSAQLGCAPDAIMCRHVEVGPAPGGGGKSEMIALAAGRGLIEKLMGGLRAAKLEPVGMHPECVALMHCFDHITRRTSDVDLTSLYIDIGRSGTRLAIAHGAKLVFAKHIQLGGRALDDLAAAQLKCDRREAARQRQAAIVSPPSNPVAARPPAAVAAATVDGVPAAASGAPTSTEGFAVLAAGMKLARPGKSMTGTQGPSEPASPLIPPPEQRSGRAPVGHTVLRDEAMSVSRLDLREGIESLTDEITMCLRYHETVCPGKRPERVIFVGGEARHLTLCQQIARALKAPAHVADPLARVSRTGTERCEGVRLSEPQPGWAVAMGLSMSPTDL